MLFSEYSFETEKRTTTDIHVEMGLLNRPDFSLLLGLAQGSNHFVITDQTVYRLYGDALVERLRDDVPGLNVLVLPDGEQTKSLQAYAKLANEIAEHDPDERTTLIALGGGVVANVTGMLAATLYRGVRLVHIPTTLMAQCDAAIGQKQAINLDVGKNLLGAYHAPDAIFVDPNVLQTLERWQRQDGFAEIAKHALAQDAAYLEYLFDPRAELDDVSFLATCVEKNISLKCELMRNDPLERNEGMVLQYGHTVGHAVEHASAYALGHGESVAIGMMAAASIAEALGVASRDVLQMHRELLHKYGLLRVIPAGISTADLIRGVAAGKRCVGETAYMALVQTPGSLYQHEQSASIEVPLDTISGVLSKQFVGDALSEHPRLAVGAS